MAWIRYLLYFVLITAIMALLARLEIAYPGSLRLLVFTEATDSFGTSEFSPVEMIQPLILAISGLVLARVAISCVSQRPVAIIFGGVALTFTILELDYFLDRYLIRNLWLVLVGICIALVIAYAYRHRKRINIALGRLWPSPALALMFAGSVMIFGFVRIVGDESLWQSILGEQYRPIVAIAVEEFVELIGYLLWLVGAIEYRYQVRSIIERSPMPAAVKRRQTQRHAGNR
jgi:hypothetical protein